MILDNRMAVGAGASEANRLPGLAIEEAVRVLDKARQSLNKMADPCRLKTMPLTKLIGYLIDRHHVYARRQMAGIEALLAAFPAAEEKSLPELTRVRCLFKDLRQELLLHMEKEEVSLFPHMIRMETDGRGAEPSAAPPFGSLRDSLRMLMHEHDQLCAMLDSIRAATNDYTPPRVASASYRALCQALRDLEFDLLQHIHLEDHVLFRRALRAERPAPA